MAYYGLGSKEQILRAIYTAMRGVSGQRYVDWQRADITGPKSNQYPGIFINDSRTDRVKLCKNIIRNDFQVIIVGFVEVEERRNQNLGSKINSFSLAIESALLADPYWNNNAYGTKIETMVTDAGSRWPRGNFYLNVMIRFYSRK